MVRDSTLNRTNDLQVFSETFEEVILPGHESLVITCDVCPGGATSATKDMRVGAVQQSARRVRTIGRGDPYARRSHVRDETAPCHPCGDPERVVRIRAGEGGLRGRLQTEHDLVTNRDGSSKLTFQGHGIAVQRTGATVVAGPVSWSADPDLSWIRKDDDLTGLGAWSWNPRDWEAPWDKTIERRLSSPEVDRVVTAEKVAIRAAVYLGDVGFAVNSKLAGAWGAQYGPNDKGWGDGAAWAAVRKLVGQAAGLPDAQDDPGVPQAIKERLGELVDESTA
jgi:hypothetical protein